MGVVRVPDKRIDALSSVFSPKKTTYAEMSFCDIPGEHGAEKKGLSPRGLQQIRDQEALCLVLRDFANPALEGEADPEGADLLLLTPLKKRKRSRLQEIRIWLHPETGHTQRIRYLEKNGDVTTFSFSNVQVNAGIPETVYHIDLPADVSMGDSFSGFAGG